MTPSSTAFGPLLRLLGSVQLAFGLLGGGALVLAAGTVLESRLGPEIARATLYQTPWFDVYLLLLATNLVLSVVVRVPIQRSQWAFALTHFAIVLVLIGVWTSRTWGYQGEVRVLEGIPGDTFYLDHSEVVLVDLNASADSMHVYPLAAILSPTSQLLQRKTAQLPRLEVLDRLHHGRVHEQLRVVPQGTPGVQLRLHGAHGDHDVWLLSGDENRRRRQLDALNVELLRFSDDPEFERRLALTGSPQGPLTTLSILLGPEGAMAVQAGNSEGRTAARRVRVGEQIDLPLLDMELRVIQRLESCAPTTLAESSSAGRAGSEPCLLLRVGEGDSAHEFWAALDNSRQLHIDGRSFDLVFRRSYGRLPFTVALEGRESAQRSGTELPEGIEGRLVLSDLAGKNPSLVAHIAPNETLGYMGFTFTQKGYSPATDDQGATALLLVSHDPGVQIIYVAFVLLVLGVAWFIFGKGHRRLWSSPAGSFSAVASAGAPSSEEAADPAMSKVALTPMPKTRHKRPPKIPMK